MSRPTSGVVLPRLSLGSGGRSFLLQHARCSGTGRRGGSQRSASGRLSRGDGENLRHRLGTGTSPHPAAAARLRAQSKSPGRRTRAARLPEGQSPWAKVTGLGCFVCPSLFTLSPGLKKPQTKQKFNNFLLRCDLKSTPRPRQRGCSKVRRLKASPGREEKAGAGVEGWEPGVSRRAPNATCCSFLPGLDGDCPLHFQHPRSAMPAKTEMKTIMTSWKTSAKTTLVSGSGTPLG